MQNPEERAFKTQPFPGPVRRDVPSSCSQLPKLKLNSVDGKLTRVAGMVKMFWLLRAAFLERRFGRLGLIVEAQVSTL